MILFFRIEALRFFAPIISDRNSHRHLVFSPIVERRAHRPLIGFPYHGEQSQILLQDAYDWQWSSGVHVLRLAILVVDTADNRFTESVHDRHALEVGGVVRVRNLLPHQ